MRLRAARLFPGASLFLRQDLIEVEERVRDAQIGGVLEWGN